MDVKTKKYVHVVTLVIGFLILAILYIVFGVDYQEPEPVVAMPDIEEIRDRRELAEKLVVDRQDERFKELLELMGVKEDKEQPLPTVEMGKDPF